MTLRALSHQAKQTQHQDDRALQKGQIALVDLTDFDVQIGVTQNDGIQIFEVTDLVTRWMQQVFGDCLASGGWAVETYAQFDTIILLQRTNNGRRGLQVGDDEDPIRIGALYTAEFKGAALFTKKENQTRVPDVAVYDCQRISFLEDDLLLDAFQNSGAAGLGTAVVDAQAYVNPNSGGSNGSSDSSLELVIVIAIIIACVAFLFLIFAIFWAWRYDKQNRQAFLSEGRKADETVDANNSPETQKERPKVAKDALPAPSYPSVIGGESVADGGVYAESVISEDIHSSLSQYYAGGTSANYNYNSGRLQDAASVSSMESYGYSLDGYTPSYTVGAPALTPLPTEPANTDSWMDTKDLRQKEADKSADWGVSTDYAVPPSSALDGVAAVGRTDDPMDENSEVEPPSYAEDMSYMDSTMAEESAIHTTILR